MRMTATGVIMAQLGMLVPAESARYVLSLYLLVSALIRMPIQLEPRGLDHNAHGCV